MSSARGMLLVGFVAVWSISAAPAPQTFVGVVADSECPNGDHSRMMMGETNRECALACADSHSASFVLAESEKSYELSDQAKAKPFAGHMVRVVGTLEKNEQRIVVESMSALP